jgi:hypothetical protein
MFVEYKEVTDILIGRFGKERFVDDLAGDDFEARSARMAKAMGAGAAELAQDEILLQPCEKRWRGVTPGGTGDRDVIRQDATSGTKTNDSPTTAASAFVL